MAFSYDSAQLDEPKNKLRFLVQDTVDAGHFFDDAEIVFALAEETNIYRAAASLCRSAALKVLQRAGLDEKEGIKYDPEAKSKEYRELARMLDKKADEKDASLDGGGQSGEPGGGIRLPKINCAKLTFTRDMHLTK